jgi:hypothetical protein
MNMSISAATGPWDAGARRHGWQMFARSSAKQRTMSEANLGMSAALAPGGKAQSTPCADASLVAAIGDGSMLREELYVRYRRPLLQVFLQRRVQRDVAEDLLQRTFLQAIQKIRSDGLEDPSKLGGYLYRTACNLATAYWRGELARRQESTTRSWRSGCED